MQIVDEKSFKILVITENQNYRNTLGAKLRFEGFNVEFSESGFQAIHLLERHNDYNLVIMHENMHDMPSFEIISLIRTFKAKNDLPIIYISKQQKEEDVCEMVFIGANDYIVQSSNFMPITDRVKKYFTTLKAA